MVLMSVLNGVLGAVLVGTAVAFRSTADKTLPVALIALSEMPRRIADVMVGFTGMYICLLDIDTPDLTSLGAELEVSGIALQRMQFIADLAREEAGFDTTELVPHRIDWIKTGEVRFTNVSLRYSLDAPLALCNINLHVKSGQRVGIVGRSGSGKSTLLSALLRLVEVEEADERLVRLNENYGAITSQSTILVCRCKN